ncbi:polysaccharide_lyase 8 family protein [Hexamita inflata]|uniref:Polysaccharide lyase 8 family protein n=1 Tax=Hexamita inflata TaxID=28002 RepID=A0AA86UP26_9EUKA|nr:polysaccharide lyase 8 family protein [Hexamita inflata]
MQLTSNRTYLWDNLKRIDQDTQLEWTMSNLQQIAVAYAVKPYNNYTNIHYQNITTFQILTDAIDFVLSNFYRADLEQLTPPLSGTGYQNQWQWQIAVPEILNNIVILIKDSISNNLLQKVVLSSRRFMPNASYLYNLYNPKATPSLSTGGNLVDTARICFLRGLISQNLIEADYSFHSLDHILDFVTTSDGFYKDYSFIQHRVIVASASYGYTLFNGLTGIILIINGSERYYYTQSSLQHIFKYIIEAEVPFIYKGQMMNMVNGRAICRKEQEYRTGGLFVGLIAILSECTNDSILQYQLKQAVKTQVLQAQPHADFTYQDSQMANKNIKSIMNDSNITVKPEFLHKRFSSMDRVIHRRENYAFAIAMHSNRVGDYESMDGENLHGWYTGDGMEYMYSNNQQQYTDFFPTVNPYLLQGTTELIVHRNDGEVDGAMNVQMSNATFVGGTDLNGTGVVGMEFYNYNYKLSGFRSWFMFEQSVMVIAQYNSSETYRSTFLNRQLENLNQSVFVDGVEINNEIKAYNCSKLFVEGTGHNDSVGYIFLKKTEIHLKKQVRTGDWNQIGTYSGATQRNYVTGYIEKTNDLQVQYVIIFGCNKQKFELINQSKYEIIQNNSMHMVQYEENNITYIMANIFNLSLGQCINIQNFSFYSNCSILIRVSDEIQLSISDPTQKQSFLKYKYNNQLNEVNVTQTAGASFIYNIVVTPSKQKNSCGVGCIVGITFGVVIILIGITLLAIFISKKNHNSKFKSKSKGINNNFTILKARTEPIF